MRVNEALLKTTRSSKRVKKKVFSQPIAANHFSTHSPGPVHDPATNWARPKVTGFWLPFSHSPLCRREREERKEDEGWPVRCSVFRRRWSVSVCRVWVGADEVYSFPPPPQKKKKYADWAIMHAIETSSFASSFVQLALFPLVESPSFPPQQYCFPSFPLTFSLSLTFVAFPFYISCFFFSFSLFSPHNTHSHIHSHSTFHTLHTLHLQLKWPLSSLASMCPPQTSTISTAIEPPMMVHGFLLTLAHSATSTPRTRMTAGTPCCLPSTP